MTRRPIAVMSGVVIRLPIAAMSCVERALSPKRRGTTRRRVMAVVVGLVVLTAAGPVANAADDPQPVEWPRAEASSTDAKSDPAPVDWPRPQQF
jgi:glucose dehydrogenase